MLTDISTYVWALFEHWLFSWGAVALMVIAMLEKWWKPIPKKLFFGLAGGLLLASMFQAWRDEHIHAESLGHDRDMLATSKRASQDRVAELEKQLEAVKSSRPQTPTKEPGNSLRRRTVQLANELDAFIAERWAKRPTDQDGARQYDQATTDLYLSLYRSRTIGILQELQAKGLDVGLLAAPGAAQSRYLMGDETKQLRDLAFHLDDRGNTVRF